jgi:hypothetical protein
VQNFKAGDRVKVTMTRSFEGDAIGWPNSPSGLGVRTSQGGVYRLDEAESIGGFTYTFELITPAEPPVGSVLVDSVGDVWIRRASGWAVTGDGDIVPWSEVSSFGPFKVLREGWGE